MVVVDSGVVIVVDVRVGVMRGLMCVGMAVEDSVNTPVVVFSFVEVLRRSDWQDADRRSHRHAIGQQALLRRNRTGVLVILELVEVVHHAHRIRLRENHVGELYWDE